MLSSGEQAGYDYDVAVVGGGSSGYAAARTATREGLKTVLFEGGEEVGGLCILRGCMPTKALLYAAEVMRLASHPDPWGIRVEDVRFNWPGPQRGKTPLFKSSRNTAVNNWKTADFDLCAPTRRSSILILSN